MIERRRANSFPGDSEDDGDEESFLAASVVDPVPSDEEEISNNNDENVSPAAVVAAGGCLPLQQPSTSTTPLPLSRSPAAWLEDSFETDPTDQLLGSFTCAYCAHILIQGKIFIVRGERRGARVLFFSNIMRRGVMFRFRMGGGRGFWLSSFFFFFFDFCFLPSQCTRKPAA